MHLSAKYAPPAATLKKDLDLTQQFVTTVWLRCHSQHQESPTAGLCLHQQDQTVLRAPGPGDQAPRYLPHNSDSQPGEEMETVSESGGGREAQVPQGETVLESGPSGRDQEETGPSRQGIYQGSLQEPLVQSEQQEPHDLILITNTRKCRAASWWSSLPSSL